MASEEVPDSVLGRLLEELSWVGSTIRNYRRGGIGYENVLTAEALTALDFLPRDAFLGEVLRAAQGADAARLSFAAEVEDTQITLLPEQLFVGDTQRQVAVQPDGILVSPSCWVLLEAKRIRSSSFQPEQLAREYVALLNEAGERTPLLLLILGSAPPVPVKGAGRLTIEEAVALSLDSVLARYPDGEFDVQELLARVPDVFAWITWERLAQVVAEQHRAFSAHDPSVSRSITRLADSVTHAVQRHSADPRSG